MKKFFRSNSNAMLAFIIATTFSSLASGFSDTIYSNYFKDAYLMTTLQRGFTELPRELPGMLCIFVIALLSPLGEHKLVMFAQLLTAVGVLALGLLTPPLYLMLIFLFINSLGMHMSMPLQDTIGMTLAETGQVGRRMGQYNAFKTAAQMVAAFVVFVGFRMGFFSFTTPLKIPFLLAAGFLFVSAGIYVYLIRVLGPGPAQKQKPRFVFRKEYKYFYILALTRGLEKQMTFVYIPWILIQLLGKGTDTTALLIMISYGLSVFLLPGAGRLIDRFGSGALLVWQALLIITVYASASVVCLFISRGADISSFIIVAAVFIIFIVDRIAFQLVMVRTVYMKSIAVSASDVSPVLSTGISIDHVVTISTAYLGGVIWTVFGPEYLFGGVAAVSLFTLFISVLAKKDLASRAA